MLTYNFANKGNIPLYVFLYSCIKNDINNGIIKPNEKLPSKRALSAHLNISVITVENAYIQLISEGYIRSVEKKGYYTNKIEHTHINEKQPYLNKNPSISKSADYFVDFCDKSIITENFPFSTWAKLTRQVLTEKDNTLLKRQSYKGTDVLRQSLVDFLFHFRGMNITKEQIIIGAGTEYLYGILGNIVGREKTIAIENPGYSQISAIYKNNGIKYTYVDMDTQGLCIDGLEKSNVSVAHISPSHHFPTGITMPITRRIEILDWANKASDRYIIEDDYDSEFRYTAKPIPTMQSIDKNEKVIYINTFSKTISPAIRISYMILPQSLLSKSDDYLQTFSCAVSSLEQYTLAKFIEKGFFERHLNRMTRVYKIKRDLIINEIYKNFNKSDFHIFEENAGLHFILQINTDLSDDELISNALKYGIKISAISKFFFNKPNFNSHQLLINYSGIDNDKIPEGIEKLAQSFLTLNNH